MSPAMCIVGNIKKIQSIRKIFILDNKIESSTRDHEGADIILIAKGIKYISKNKIYHITSKTMC